jgi:hypothetical protein
VGLEKSPQKEGWVRKKRDGFRKKSAKRGMDLRESPQKEG